MQTKVIFALAAIVLLAAVYAASEAFARGGGGGGGGRGGHGGMISGFHGFASHGMRRMGNHAARFPFKEQHSHGMHNVGQKQHDHHHMMAQGQWHSIPGFGGHGQKWSNTPGVWHKVASFGSRGQINNARDFRRDWQVGGGGGGGGDWGYGGSVGDLCMTPGSCQGMWQVVPQSNGQPKQSRSFQRDWRVDGEL